MIYAPPQELCAVCVCRFPPLLLSSSYLLRLFFFPFIYFPSSSPVSTPSPSPAQSDIIVHIPTLLPWHTLEHRAYRAPLSTRSHISFLQWQPILPFPSSPLATHLLVCLVFFSCLMFSSRLPPSSCRCHIVTRADYRHRMHGSVFKCPK